MAVLLLWSASVFAARPFVTDDAGIADKCELEVWWQSQEGEQHSWLSPICSVGQFEFTLAYGAGLSDEADQYEIAIKTELINMDERSWGLAVELAHESAEHQAFKGQTQLVGIVSKAWLADKLMLHFNAGRIRYYDESNDWLLATALQWSPLTRHSVFAELFREQAGRPFYQLGYIYELIEDVMQVDMSYGSRLNRSGSERMLSLGFVYNFD